MDRGLINRFKRDAMPCVTLVGFVITGVLIGMFIATICYERRDTKSYASVTSQHAELYKQSSCNAAECHRERKGRR